MPARGSGGRNGALYAARLGPPSWSATSDAPALVVEKHKGAGLNRYFRKFAETPGEKFAARVLGPLIGVLLSMRARMRQNLAVEPRLVIVIRGVAQIRGALA